jgi:hypothetical protein
MPNRISVCIALAALTAAPAILAATATVEYVNPEKFTDAGNVQFPASVSALSASSRLT